MKPTCSTPYRRYGPPQTFESCEEKYARAAERARDEVLAEFLYRVRIEIKATARERLAMWVAKQNHRNSPWQK